MMWMPLATPIATSSVGMIVVMAKKVAPSHAIAPRVQTTDVTTTSSGSRTPRSERSAR